MTRWNFLYIGDESLSGVYLELDESTILANGSAVAPFLQIRPRMVARNGRDWRDLGGEGIHAMSISLSGQNQSLLAVSGFQPFNPQTTSIHVPVPKAWIDEECHRPPTTVTVYLGFAVLHSIPGQIQVSTTQPQQIQISRQQWLEWLPRWGYPRTRTVEVAVELLAALESQQPDAQEIWKKNAARLQYAEAKILSPASLRDIEDGVKALRDVVDGALRTWLTLWGATVPDKVELHALLQWVNSGIPQCNAPEGKVKAKPAISNDNMRLCSHAIALQNLITLTNPTHHFGTQSIYSQVDAESWLFMVLGETRSLPELWTQYPGPQSPLTAPNGLTTTPTPPHDPSVTASATQNPGTPPAKTSDNDGHSDNV